MKPRRTGTAGQIAELQQEVRRLLAATIAQPASATPRPMGNATARAREAGRGITLSLPEIHLLLTTSSGSRSRDVAADYQHALLVIAARHTLDTLAGPSSDDDAVTRAAVRALARSVRSWLRASDRRLARRAAHQAAADARATDQPRPAKPPAAADYDWLILPGQKAADASHQGAITQHTAPKADLCLDPFTVEKNKHEAVIDKPERATPAVRQQQDLLLDAN